MTKPIASAIKVHNIEQMSDEDWVSQLQQNRCIVRLISHDVVAVEYPSLEIFDSIEAWLSARKEQVMEVEY